MAHGWRVLDAASFEGSIGTRRGQLCFSKDDGAESFVPIADVGVILLGLKTTVSVGALQYLAANDVSALTCDWRGVPTSGFYAWSDHTRVGARHLAQARLTRPRAKNAWMRIIKAKVLGQAATLRIVDELGAGHLEGIANDIRSGDPGNAEALAARWYWRRLFAEHSFQRDQDGTDGLNSMLNYGYGVLRGFGIRAVTGAGLSPALGIFHRNRSNFFNLVDDLVEPFRPAIDAAVVRAPRSVGLEGPEIKKLLVAAANQPFSQSGTGVVAELEALAQRFGQYAEGDIDRLPVTVWSDPDRGAPDVDQW